MDTKEVLDEIIRVSGESIDLRHACMARDVVQLEICRGRPCRNPCRASTERWEEVYLNLWSEYARRN